MVNLTEADVRDQGRFEDSIGIYPGGLASVDMGHVQAELDRQGVRWR